LVDETAALSAINRVDGLGKKQTLPRRFGDRPIEPIGKESKEWIKKHDIMKSFSLYQTANQKSIF